MLFIYFPFPNTIKVNRSNEDVHWAAPESNLECLRAENLFLWPVKSCVWEASFCATCWLVLAANQNVGMPHREHLINEFSLQKPQSGTWFLQSGKAPMKVVSKKEFLELMIFSLFSAQSRVDPLQKGFIFFLMLERKRFYLNEKCGIWFGPGEELGKSLQNVVLLVAHCVLLNGVGIWPGLEMVERINLLSCKKETQVCKTF